MASSYLHRDVMIATLCLTNSSDPMSAHSAPHACCYSSWKLMSKGNLCMLRGQRPGLSHSQATLSMKRNKQKLHRSGRGSERQHKTQEKPWLASPYVLSTCCQTDFARKTGTGTRARTDFSMVTLHAGIKTWHPSIAWKSVHGRNASVE